VLRFRGLRNSIGYFSHVKYFMIDIYIDIDKSKAHMRLPISD